MTVGDHSSKQSQGIYVTDDLRNVACISVEAHPSPLCGAFQCYAISTHRRATPASAPSSISTS